MKTDTRDVINARVTGTSWTLSSFHRGYDTATINFEDEYGEQGSLPVTLAFLQKLDPTKPIKLEVHIVN